MHRALPVIFLVLELLAARSAQGALSARGLSRQLGYLSNDVDRIAQGQENALRRNAGLHAAELYRLEHRAIALHQMAEQVLPRANERVAYRDHVRTLLDGIYRLQGRALDHAVDRLNEALPGADGAMWLRSYRGHDVFQPNYRSSARLPKEEQRKRLTEMRAEAREKATPGKRSIVRLDRGFLRTLGSGQLVEWVKVGAQTMATTSGANHPVIAAGRSARGAGGLKVWKDVSGQIALAVASNWSGNYKPGPASAIMIAHRLSRSGIERTNILITTSTPDDPIIAGLFRKAQGQPKDQIKSYLRRLEKVAARDVSRMQAGKRPPRLGVRTRR